MGDNVEQPDAGKVIEVEEAVRHPDYDDTDLKNDLSVLVLAEDADVTPRPLVGEGVLEDAHTVRLAGYGNTDVDSMGGYGIRRMVDVPLASNDPAFGADPETEFVAGAPFLDRDSCNGDSGGPAYVRSGDSWYRGGSHVPSHGQRDPEMRRRRHLHARARVRRVDPLSSRRALGLVVRKDRNPLARIPIRAKIKRCGTAWLRAGGASCG